MNIVVTGATSFIGAPMVDKLIEMGHDVYAVVRPASKNLARLGTGRERLHVIEMNLQEADRLDDVILVPCEAFFHFGWDGAGSDNRMNRAVQQQNVADSLKAMEGAKKLGCRSFLFSGSQAEYGIHREAMTEDTPLNPVSEYGKAKVDFCRQAMELTDRWNQAGCDCHGDSCAERGSDRFRYIHARIFSIYGPGDHPWSLVESCLKTFPAGGCLSLGECTQMWNFLYLDDLLEALTALWLNGADGIFNVAGEKDETRPLKDYVRLMYEACGCHGSYSCGRRPQNAEGPANLIPDVKKLMEATGWRQETPFKEGIRRMINRKKIDKQEFLWYER